MSAEESIGDSASATVAPPEDATAQDLAHQYGRGKRKIIKKTHFEENCFQNHYSKQFRKQKGLVYF